MKIIEKLYKQQMINNSSLFLLPLLNVNNNFGSQTRSFFNILCDNGLLNTYLKDKINSEYDSDCCIYLFFENINTKERDSIFKMLENLPFFLDSYLYEEYTVLVFTLHEYRDLLNNFYDGKYSNFQDNIIKIYESSTINLYNKKKLSNKDYHIDYIKKVIKKDEKLKNLISDFFKCEVNELHSKNHYNNVFTGTIEKIDFKKSNQFFKELLSYTI